MDSDWILLYQMRQGSDAAWDTFVRKYYGDILKYCHFHSQNRENAEDLTQEVFLKFFSALAQYQHLGKVKNYLYTIARNLCYDQALQRKDMPLEREVYTDQTAEWDARFLLEAAIRSLPEELREVVVLHYYQGLKLTETAAVLHIGLPLVKYRLKRAKEGLRKELDYGSE